MAEYSVVLSEAAIRDLEEIRDYIRRDDPDAASRFVDLMEEHLAALASFPQMGRAWDYTTLGKYRVLVVENYLAFYVVTGNTVHVRRVVHGARGLDNLLEPLN